MYEYIKGTITRIESNYIVLENNNIGYLIYTPNPYLFKEENEEIIYIYDHVKEDEHLLYGFKSKEDKELFLKLIGVKGLGCKMAMPMLATGSINGIVDAIERENILYLTKFPKIGDKVAKQIILDLKGKVKSDGNYNSNYNFDELIEVLKNLGYKNSDISRILPSINIDEQIESQIKEALKLLLK